MTWSALEPAPISPGNHGLQALQDLVTAIEDQPTNEYPIVLVSGFSGWGEPLFGTVNHWGGFRDLPKALHKAGYAVIVVKIGPFSSNMERASEIYTQLRSGAFDEAGGPYDSIPISYNFSPGDPILGQPFDQTLIAAARTWRAILYGSLPTGWTWDAKHPVHFICHSQGGTSVRYLAQHMTEFSGFPDLTSDNWIRSIVTIGTPHKGTTVTDVATSLLGLNTTDEALARLVMSASFHSRGSRFYDLQLDHWGFARQGSETLEEMYDRVRPLVALWWQSNEHGFYDNSIAGMAAMNDLPSPSIAYFTMSFCATLPFPNRTLTTQQINSFLDLFPASWIWNAGGFWGHASWPFRWAASQIPGLPTLQQYAGWAIEVANSHLAEMGYFSRIPQPGSQVPRPDVLPLIAPTAYAIGGYNKPRDDLPNITSLAYQPNDGIVNTLSMSGPIGSDTRAVRGLASAVGTPAINGQYWHFGENATIDHADQIGVFTNVHTVSCLRYGRLPI